jgi:hypothetical protein
MLVVVKMDSGLVQLAALFDEDLIAAVDHDVGHVVVAQQRLERPQAE